MEIRTRNKRAKYSDNFQCFFCKTNANVYKRESPSIKLSLSDIFNYLQKFPRGKEKLSNEDLDEKLSSSFSMCGHCSLIAMEFSELHRLLGETEERLNMCLDRIQELMTKADHDKPNDKDENLRTAMIGRITEVSKLSRRAHIGITSSPAKDSKVPEATNSAPDLFPSPDIDKMDIVDKIEPHRNHARAGPELDSESGSGSEEVEVNNSVMKRNKKRKKIESPAKSDSDSSTVSLHPSKSSKKEDKPKPICKFCNKSFCSSFVARRHMKYNCKNRERQPRPESSDTALVLTCAYCDYEGANRPYKMNHHLIRRHPEMFFQSEKDNSSLPSHWKEEHFKDIVKEIVFPKFILRNGSSPSCSCSVCGKTFGPKRGFPHNRSDLTIHLVNEHIQELRDYLNESMGRSDASLQKKLNRRN